MKKLLAFVCLLSLTAYAGERLLGVISSISTTTSNLSQNPDGAFNWWDGGYQQPFLIPEMALVTVRCDIDTYVCTDMTSCTAVTGLPVPGTVVFPTSVGARTGAIDQGPNPDAGAGNSGTRAIRSASIAVLSTVVDGGYHGCSVWERKGNE